jgi:hypothetical protein
MVNSENSPVFVESILKVTAKEDMDLTKELAQENTENLSIDELLAQNEKTKE